jgi:hypothetical protein
MKKNMGTVDRIIRIIIAAILVVLFAMNVVPGFWGILLLVVAAVFVLTSFVSFCPIYRIFGASTCATKPSGEKS